MLQLREADVPSLFLVLVVFPLITYFLLGIWNEAAKKKAKLSMLAQIAAEETIGVQATASADIVPTIPSPKIGSHLCAQCFSPAKTRCARCKSVRYCSGRCQIMHWRLGHKEQCRQQRHAVWTLSAVSAASQSIEHMDYIGNMYTNSSSNFLNIPDLTCETTSNVVVDAYYVPVSGTRISSKHPEDFGSYADETTVSNLSCPSLDALASQHKPGIYDLSCSNEHPKSQDTNTPNSSEECSVSNNFIHHSHKSMGTMRKMLRESQLPDSSKLGPIDGDVMNNSGSSSQFIEKDDSQECSMTSISDASELCTQAASTFSQGNAKFKKPPYVLAPLNPTKSDKKTSGMGDLESTGAGKLPKALKRNLMEFVNHQKKKKVLFPYEDLVKLFQCEIQEISPRGLLNCGNSCYANAVLQCLTCTKPLMSYLLQRLHSKTCWAKDWCLMCELERHVSHLRESREPMSPDRLLSNMRNIGWRKGGGKQEDAHEFLRVIVMSMQSICLEGFGGENKVDPALQETTLIQQLFGGRLRSKVKCLRCHLESERYENIMDLTLEIHGWVESLEDALTQFTAPEDLDGENMYRCGRCTAYVKARKQLSLHEVPNILTVVLKRFQTGEYGKINKCVTFPDILDMIPFVTGTADTPPLYMLYAVVVHLDNLNASFSGHYVSYVKDIRGTWFRINDSQVQEVTFSQVMSEGAYMLFYSRSFPRAPSIYAEKTPSRAQNQTDKTSCKIFKKFGEDMQSRDWPAYEDTPQVQRSYNPKFRDILEDLTESSISDDVYPPRGVPRDSLINEFSDASSDWSLFTSSSDEASFTTDSSRNSFSTIDYGENVGMDSLSSIFYPYVSEYNKVISCTRLAPCRPETRFFSESKGFVLGSLTPSQPATSVDKERNW